MHKNNAFLLENLRKNSGPHIPTWLGSGTPPAHTHNPRCLQPRDPLLLSVNSHSYTGDVRHSGRRRSSMDPVTEPSVIGRRQLLAADSRRTRAAGVQRQGSRMSREVPGESDRPSAAKDTQPGPDSVGMGTCISPRCQHVVAIIVATLCHVARSSAAEGENKLEIGRYTEIIAIYQRKFKMCFIERVDLSRYVNF